MEDFWENITKIHRVLRNERKQKYKRTTSFGDLFTDRWERANFCGFGEGTSCYDNVLILGDVEVGKNCWIGPNVILDGSGGLSIGDHCDISAAVQIYSHDTVRRTVSLGKEDIEYAATKIGSGVYIGPQTIIQKGVTIGNHAIIGAMSLVNRDIPSGYKAWGVPIELIGKQSSQRRP